MEELGSREFQQTELYNELNKYFKKLANLHNEDNSNGEVDVVFKDYSKDVGSSKSVVAKSSSDIEKKDYKEDEEVITLVDDNADETIEINIENNNLDKIGDEITLEEILDKQINMKEVSNGANIKGGVDISLTAKNLCGGNIYKIDNKKNIDDTIQNILPDKLSEDIEDNNIPAIVDDNVMIGGGGKKKGDDDKDDKKITDSEDDTDDDDLETIATQGDLLDDAFDKLDYDDDDENTDDDDEGMTGGDNDDNNFIEFIQQLHQQVPLTGGDYKPKKQVKICNIYPYIIKI